MELYLIRHGKTVWNKENRFQGIRDIDLAPEGINKAQELGKKLEGIQFDKVFSSSLKRAYQTAQLATQNRYEIIKDKALTEINFGAMEGQTYEDMEKSTSNFRYFFTAPEKFQPAEGGESLEHMCQRTKEFIQKKVEPIYKINPQAKIMIVAHGALNKAIMCYLENHGLKDFWKDGLQENCQATIFEYNGNEWSKIKE